jgi:hypothetical protein
MEWRWTDEPLVGSRCTSGCVGGCIGGALWAALVSCFVVESGNGGRIGGLNNKTPKFHKTHHFAGIKTVCFDPSCQ